jgi:hypothetical protein
MSLQDKIDSAYPRYYDYDVEISKKQWLELLQDRDIFKEKNIEHMKCIYAFENHAATCKEVSGILGDKSSTYVGLATALAKRIAAKLNIESLPARKDSGDVYWYILFYGQKVNDRESGNFEWKLKPELAAALKERFQELEYPKPIIEKKLDDVPTSVWLATVLLTYMSYKNVQNLEEMTIYHQIKEIQKVAKQICCKNIDYARPYQWCNGDHNDHTYCYLRSGEKALRRLTAPGEFGGEKERPKNLDPDMEFEMDDGIITVRMLIDFVEGEYSDLINSGEIEQVENIVLELSLNSILYGPPGTGKTYNTVLYAVAICDKTSLDSLDSLPYEELQKRYEDLKKEGRISFTTFHQSYGYEEFIEGIKPVISRQDDDSSSDIKYEHASGVFKKFCEKAKKVKVKTSSLKIRENPMVWNVLLEGTGQTELKEKCFKNDCIKIGWTNADKIVTEQSANLNDIERRILLNFQDEMQEGDIVFIQRRNTSIDAIGIIIGPCEYIESDKKYPRTRSVQWIATGINEDVYALNKNTKLDRKSVYPLRNMDIKEVISLIEKYTLSNEISVEENVEPHIFIIDEINRGNISKIFGELITLIEPTKRIGESEAVTAILPYSGVEFGVPNNVYILGTMNTADRSIALMDTALRRRFKFIEMMPDSSILTKLGIMEVEGINIVAMLKAINERIEYLFDREHTIGHAYFTPLEKNPSLKNLAGIFLNAIIPLLQEYFYEDYSKIQLVLGDNAKMDNAHKFILDTEIKVKNVFKGNPDIDLPEKKYTIQTDAFYQAESYKQIY